MQYAEDHLKLMMQLHREGRSIGGNTHGRPGMGSRANRVFSRSVATELCADCR